MILKAYAKINITLDITGRRDDGYHIIDSVFQSVGVFDTVEVSRADEISVSCGDMSGEKNIAFSAAKYFFKTSGIKGGADIKVQKAIPVLSGLGGGSADAAAVITALDRIYNTSLSRERLIKIATECGADVPFFLIGGTARVGGIGEKVTPIPNLKGYYALLLKAGDKKSTADMYRRIDGMPALNPSTQKFVTLTENGDLNSAFKNVGNAFSPLCADENVLKALKSQNPLCVSVSGSGPTHFAVFGSEHTAKAACENLENSGYEPIYAPFVNYALCEVE